MHTTSSRIRVMIMRAAVVVGGIFMMAYSVDGAELAAASSGKSAGLLVYAAPPGAPHNEAYTVRVREVDGAWTNLFAYDAVVDEEVKGHMGFASFDSDFAKPVEVEVHKIGGRVNNARIRPASAKVVSRVTADTITFTLTRPAKVSVEVNGELHSNLMIFANPREENPVAGPGPGIHYFGPGVHNLGIDGRGMLKLADGETVYIAGGAIVYGNIEVSNLKLVYGGLFADGVKNVTIRGRGILCGSKFEHNLPANSAAAPLMIQMHNVTNAVIEGITLLDTVGWNVLLSSCSQVRVSNVKIIGWRTNSDGVNPVDSNHVTIEDCFIRNHDDCFSIKLRYHLGPKTAISGCRNITIQNCVVWADKGRSFLIGPESSGEGPREFADITFRNIDILRVRNWTTDWAFGALAINCGDGATVKNVLIEDVRIEGVENACPINFRIVKTMFNADAGDRIENVTLRNVSLTGPNATGNAIVGLDDKRCVDGVHFKNLTIDGKVIRSAAEGGFTIQNAKNVTFEP
jgi:polygalacturonase